MAVEAQVNGPEEQHSSVFISYAREDIGFVRLLDAALRKRNRESWVDLEDIRPTEEWLASVFSGIESANAFVFVISPDSVESKSCLRELAHAVMHSKRLVPIVCREVDASTVPDPLRSPQWIFFRDGDDFEEAFQQLVDALDTDLEWVHAHTRLLVRAIEWDANGRNNSFVLRGSDLRTAEEWQVRAADKEPKLTPLQTEYVLASRRDTTRRRTLALGAVTVALVVAVALAVLFLLARNEAERQASIALSRQLTAQAQLAAEQEPQPLQRSVLLAIEARQQSPLPSFEADQILRDALMLLPRTVTHLSTKEDVHLAAFSPDGENLATAGARNVRIWDVSSGSEVTRWLRGEGWVQSIAFSRDGKYLLVVSGDGTFEIRNVDDGEVTFRTTIPHEGSEQPDIWDGRFNPNSKYLYVVRSVYNPSSQSSESTIQGLNLITGEVVARMQGGESVSFSEDGEYVATAEGKTVRVLNTSSREQITRVSVNRSASVTLSPDGGYFATVEDTTTGTTHISTARVWETSSGEEIANVTQEAPIGTEAVGISDVALSRGGKYLATQSPDRSVRVWDTADDKEVARVTHEDAIRHMIIDVTFSPDGKYLATTGADSTARVWDLTSTTSESVTMTSDADIEDVALSPDSEYLATAGTDEPVQVWNLRNGDEIARVDAFGKVVFSPNSEHFAALSSNNTVGVWQTSSGKEVVRVPHYGSTYLNRAFAYSPDGDYLVTVGERTVRLWDPVSGEELARMGHGDGVGQLAFSRSGKYLASVGSDEEVRVWDTTERETVAQITHDNDPYEPGMITDMAFSPDGEYLVTASNDRTARVWNPTSGQELARMDHGDGVTMLAFDPDGEYVATVSGSPVGTEAAASYTAHIWNVSDAKEVARVTHDNVINAIAFSPDGEYLVTASDDQTARVWNPTSGQELARMDHDDAVQDVAFSKDGTFLATASADATHVRLWRRPEDLPAEACSRLTRNFTKEEWQQYLGDQPYRKTCAHLPKPAS